MHPKTPNRRTHPPEFKARVIAACRLPGASVAGVALAHGINANVVHKWLSGIGMKRSGQHLLAASPSPLAPTQFLPVAVSPDRLEYSVPTTTQDIHLDLDLGAMQIKLHCPGGNAAAAATLLHALADMVARA